MLDILHRELVDRQVLLERVELVKIIIDSMQHDARWEDAGDINRRRTAKRIAFCSWRFHDQQGWQDALRNRRIPRGAS